MKTKKTFLFLVAVLLSVTTVLAKDFKTVVFKVDQMECSNCENKVKNNIKFEKGIKEFKTDLSTRTVTITYDTEKTDVEKLQKGFKKFKYEAVPVEGDCCKEEKGKEECDHKD